MKRLLAASVLVLVLTPPAAPYKLIGATWPTASCTFYYDPATLSSAQMAQFRAALSTWSNVSGSKFRYADGGVTTGNLSNTNGITEVSLGMLPFGAYGVTMCQFSGSVMTEADIMFNSAMNWSTTGDGVNPDFQTVAVHELGHALGLDDNNGAQSVMDTTASPTTVRRALFSDDLAAIRALYPETTPGPGPGPTPEPEPPPKTPDLQVSGVTTDPAPAPGTVVDVEFAAYNAGTADAGEFYADAYLCPPRKPRATDRWLGRISVPMSADVGQSEVGRIDGIPIPAPEALPPGTWLVGVVLDRERRVPDSNPLNNAAFALPGFKIESVPIAMEAGDTVRASLGPYGRQEHTLRLIAGTRLSVQGASKRLPHAVEFLRTGVLPGLDFVGVKTKTALDLTVPDDGDYTLAVASGGGEALAYSLRTRVRAEKRAETLSVTGEVRVPLTFYAGSAVRVTLRGLSGPLPQVTVEGAEASVALRGATGRVSCYCPDGPLTLVLSPAGAPAQVEVSVSLKPPRAGRLIVR